MRLDDVISRLTGLAHPAPGKGGGREAAVAAIFAPDAWGEASVLLIERAVRTGDPWSGQIGLPGGRREPADLDLLDTARRETREEVGVELTRSSFVASLPALQARRRDAVVDLWIQPFVFALERPPPTFVSDEVASTMWTPLSALVDPASAHVLADDPGRLFPAVRLGPHVLWGLTYRMLDELLRILGISIAGR